MKKKFVVVSACAMTGIVMLACGLPAQLAAQQPDLALTVTAQALMIENSNPNPAGDSASPTATPASQGAANTEAPAPQGTPVPSLTATPLVPMVSVSHGTYCRSGPNVAFDIVGQLSVDEKAEVVGKNTATNYWIIKTPGDPSSTCWLWGEYATVSGDISGLPELTPPPSPTPTAVSQLVETNTCTNSSTLASGYDLNGSLTWQDNSETETGFNIYLIEQALNNKTSLLATLNPNTTSYTFKLQLQTGAEPLSLGVEAFNGAGNSEMKTVSIQYNCPP